MLEVKRFIEMIEVIENKPKKSDLHLILAHGAGAPMDSDWMNETSDWLCSQGIHVYRFEFPYMQERRLNGKKRPPNTKKVLIETYNEVIDQINQKVFIGGKSMGGRISSMVLDHPNVTGSVCFGFPFHAPGKAPGDRLNHLEDVSKPVLILQGERDSMGLPDEIKGYKLSKNIEVYYLKDGDHGLKPRKKSGKTMSENLEEASIISEKFMRRIISSENS